MRDVQVCRRNGGRKCPIRAFLGLLLCQSRVETQELLRCLSHAS